MNLRELHPAFSNAEKCLMAVYEPVFDQYSQVLGISRHALLLLSAVPTFEPKPVSPAILNIRSPYTAPEHYLTILQELSNNGLLEPLEEDQFRITHQGLNALKETLDAVYDEIAQIKTFSVIKQMDLASRLKNLADACLAAPDPPGTWCIRHLRRMDPGSRAPMMVRIDQFLSELLAFRDDAHLAAWRGYESNGHAWDVLTQLWISHESTLEAVCRTLQHRGFTQEQTQHTVDYLVHKGWISQVEGKLKITPFGAEIRQTAEGTTDRFFLTPFRTFDEVYLERTLNLLDELRAGLTEA